MKIAYITAHTPFGQGETFVLEEMLTMASIGVDLCVVPRSPAKTLFHEEGKRLLTRTVRLPLFSWRMLPAVLRRLTVRPSLWGILGILVRQSRSLKILLKNLAVVPKAVFVAEILERQKVEHIHAHWGSTTATMAWIISKIAGIPWSFTLHRWDIVEDNLLRLKVKEAAFVRCISESGRRQALSIVGEGSLEKVTVLHMGVRLPGPSCLQRRRGRPGLVIACPASFVPVKGHRFLLDACALLANRGVRDVRLLLIGDGPLEKEIRHQVARYGLEQAVQLMGRLAHDALIRVYDRGEVDVVVLPSIVTEDGTQEGIPVALMEAMAYSVPVISTETGGIPELLGGGAGLMVAPGSPEALADAIEKLLTDGELRAELGMRGYERVRAAFDSVTNCRKLLELMMACRKKEEQT